MNAPEEFAQKLRRVFGNAADLVGGLAGEFEIEFGLRRAVGRAAPGFQLFAAEGALRQRGSRVTAMLIRLAPHQVRGSEDGRAAKAKVDGNISFLIYIKNGMDRQFRERDGGSRD
jgi:hypothetical protein